MGFVGAASARRLESARVKPGRAALAVLGLAVLVAGGFFSFGPPRFTWANEGLSIAYPTQRAAAALCAALGGVLAGAVLRGWARALLAALAAAALLFGGHLGRYRLSAENGGLIARGLFGTTSIPWREVTRVDNGTARVVVWGRGERQIRIETASFRPEDRSILDRTIARRIREVSSPRP